MAVDLGQAADYTAVAVNERAQITEAGKVVVHHQIRYLHRYQLGTPYPEIVESVGRLCAQLPEARDKPELWVDGTGVGKAVLDIFRSAGMSPIGVSITGGATVNRLSHNDIRIPKRELASVTQAVLQTGRITIAHDLPFAKTLEDELANFRVRISSAGSESFEGRSGVHDDLVLSLAIALWAAEKRDAVAGAGWLELARRELDQYHESRGGKPERIAKTWAVNSVEWCAEQARIAAEAVENERKSAQ